MKSIVTVFAMLFYISAANAQVTTLSYDDITSVFDQPLMAVTDFPGEESITYFTKFSPTERCTIEKVILGMSVIRFDREAGDDTLEVFLYDEETYPLVNKVKTWRFPLGNDGYPVPNIARDKPMQSPWRDVLTLSLDESPVIAPKRDFFIGVRLVSSQVAEVGSGYFRGLTFAINPDAANYERYKRYTKFVSGATSWQYAAEKGRYALYMRAVVSYDADLPDTDLTGINGLPAAATLHLSQNYPNPFTGSTNIHYTLTKAGNVSLTVHDMLGRMVATLTNSYQQAGQHDALFSAIGTSIAPGVYTFRLRQGASVVARTMMLMR